MSGPSRPPPSEPLGREIDLALAMSRERLIETHLRFVLEFVDRARGEVAPPRALGIYTRLHHLPPSDGLLLAHRLMVELGRRGDVAPADIQPPDSIVLDTEPWDPPATVFGRVLRRLRGRVNPGLREWVEVHTGRAEAALLEVHVENAIRIIGIVAGERTYAEAVELYAGMVGVHPARVETLYLLTLDRLGRGGTGRSAPEKTGQDVIALRMRESG
jgi:hypothetical protein